MRPELPPDNVIAFIDKASEAYGRSKADEFNQIIWQECLGIKSPIEQLFLVAIHLVAEVNLVPVAVASEFRDDNEGHLLIVPQWRAGKYRVDFALRQHHIDKIVVVELDGHKFHDRDERQRRYEKTRDRFFTVSGYGVLHFTGAEIVKDPSAAALEAFNLATGLSNFSIHPFDNQ